MSFSWTGPTVWMLPNGTEVRYMGFGSTYSDDAFWRFSSGLDVPHSYFMFVLRERLGCDGRITASDHEEVLATFTQLNNEFLKSGKGKPVVAPALEKIEALDKNGQRIFITDIVRIDGRVLCLELACTEKYMKLVGKVRSRGYPALRCVVENIVKPNRHCILHVRTLDDWSEIRGIASSKYERQGQWELNYVDKEDTREAQVELAKLK